VPVAPLENVPESAYELGELERDFPVSRVELWFNLLSISVLSVVFAAMVLPRVPNLLAPQTLSDFACLAIGVLATCECLFSPTVSFAFAQPK
jgi:hypothetical protein